MTNRWQEHRDPHHHKASGAATPRRTRPCGCAAT